MVILLLMGLHLVVRPPRRAHRAMDRQWPAKTTNTALVYIAASHQLPRVLLSLRQKVDSSKSSNSVSRVLEDEVTYLPLWPGDNVCPAKAKCRNCLLLCVELVCHSPCQVFLQRGEAISTSWKQKYFARELMWSSLWFSRFLDLVSLFSSFPFLLIFTKPWRIFFANLICDSQIDNSMEVKWPQCLKVQSGFYYYMFYCFLIM